MTFKTGAKGRLESGEFNLKMADTTSGAHVKRGSTPDVILAVMEELRGLLSSPRIVELIVSAAMAEAAPELEATFLQVSGAEQRRLWCGPTLSFA